MTFYSQSFSANMFLFSYVSVAIKWTFKAVCWSYSSKFIALKTKKHVRKTWTKIFFQKKKNRLYANQLTLFRSWRGTSWRWIGSTFNEFYSRKKRKNKNYKMVDYNYQKQKKTETDLGFVMAMPAIKNLITTRCYDLASPSIMHAPSNSFHYY